jgi:hypothetical protein
MISPTMSETGDFGKNNMSETPKFGKKTQYQLDAQK